MIVRACRAYLNSEALLDCPGPTPSERYSCTCYDKQTGRPYVCLGDSTGRLLAVFRIDRRWKLRRLRRLPRDITQIFDDSAESEVNEPALPQKIIDVFKAAKARWALANERAA